MLTAPTAFTSSLAAFTSSRATIRVTQARWPPEGRGKPGNPLLCLRDRTCEFDDGLLAGTRGVRPLAYGRDRTKDKIN
jgi:hypothetical protein